MTNLIDTLERDNALFKVRTEPLTHNGQIVPDRFAQIREDNKTVIGIVGKNYKTVNHVETLQSVYALLHKVSPSMMIKTTTIRGGKLITEFALTDLEFMGNSQKEHAVPSIVIKNSYDGSTRFEALMGVIRLICSNGAFVMDIAEKILNTKHQGTLNENNFYARVPSMIEQNINAYTVLYKTLDGMEIIQWDDPSLQKMGKRIVETASGTYIAEGGKSRWDQYNAFTHTLTHRESNFDSKYLSHSMLNSCLLV